MPTQFYSHHARALKYAQAEKVKAFIDGEPAEAEKIAGLSKRVGCIGYSRDTHHFYCLPLKGYNTRTYELRPHKAYGFECNCQGWQDSRRTWEAFIGEMEAIRPLLPISQWQRLKARLMAIGGNLRPPICSHVATLYEYFARQNQAKRQEAITIMLQKWE